MANFAVLLLLFALSGFDISLVSWNCARSCCRINPKQWNGGRQTGNELIVASKIALLRRFRSMRGYVTRGYLDTHRNVPECINADGFVCALRKSSKYVGLYVGKYFKMPHFYEKSPYLHLVSLSTARGTLRVTLMPAVLRTYRNVQVLSKIQ